ncbi:type II toxin-antitoxin system VapC family toxin [Deinococcus sp. SM5_A1]|uniref:type II toxin-antitoxin system VapC family toxin n=1 Tax=Deinococcus sp. SM5_A1 TaxID=3379094 RepID=UPI00385FE0D6
MSVLYVDSSALAKLYLREDEAKRQQVMALADSADEVASSAIAFAEVASAFARNFHQGKLSEPQFWEYFNSFEQDWQSVTQITVAPSVSSRASQLLKAHAGLRGMDALHLASALIIRETQTLQFLSFDDQLNTVAQAVMPDAFGWTQKNAIFKLTLQKTYYENGFFNVIRAHDHLIRSDEGEIKIIAGDASLTFTGNVNRRANLNGTARISVKGEGLKNWFQKHYRVMEVVEIEIVSPTLLKLKYPAKN